MAIQLPQELVELLGQLFDGVRIGLRRPHGIGTALVERDASVVNGTPPGNGTNPSSSANLKDIA